MVDPPVAAPSVISRSALDELISELGRRAKFYEITAGGRRQLARETASWRRFADAIGLVLQFA